MSGYARQGRPNVSASGTITRFYSTADIASVIACVDPFGVDDPCPFNPSGHGSAAACGEVVCPYCAKVFR